MRAKEFQQRRSILGTDLEERKLDGLLVFSRANIQYLCGFTGDNGILFINSERAVLFTDPRFEIQAADQTGDHVTVNIVRGPLVAGLCHWLKKRVVLKLGFEKAKISFENYEALHSGLPRKTTLLPVAGMVEMRRMVKSFEEVRLIRHSVTICSEAFSETARNLRPGIRENELAAELEYRMRKLGAQKPAFDTIVASGPRSALPHAEPTHKPLTPNKLILVDMGASKDGYSSDMTRMIFFGTPGARVRSLYAAVLEAQLAALAAVREGNTAGDVDSAARRVLESHGLGRAFVHSTGHGLGLEIHEPPRLGQKESTRLQAGMAITIEPGVYLQGFGGIRIEDTVVVKHRGCEVLTPTPKELLTL